MPQPAPSPSIGPMLGPDPVPQYTGPNPGPVPFQVKVPGPLNIPRMPPTYEWTETEYVSAGRSPYLYAEAVGNAEWTALVFGHDVEKGEFGDRDGFSKEIVGHLHRLGYNTIRFGFEDNLSAVSGPARAELVNAHADALTDVYEGYRQDLPRVDGDPGKTKQKLLLVAYSYGCAVARKWVATNKNEIDIHALVFASPPVDYPAVKAPGVALLNGVFQFSHVGDFPSILCVLGSKDELCTFEKLHKLRDRAALNVQVVPGADHAWSMPHHIERCAEKIHRYVQGGVVTKVREATDGLIYLPFEKSIEYVLAPTVNVGADAEVDVVDKETGTEGRVDVDETVVGVLKAHDPVTVLGVARVGPKNSKRRERARISSPRLDGARGWVPAEAISGDWAMRSYYVQEWSGADSDGET